MQLAVPNVVAIAVRIVIMILRTLPQVELLLNVPIVVRTHPNPPCMEGTRLARCLCNKRGKVGFC